MIAFQTEDGAAGQQCRYLPLRAAAASPAEGVAGSVLAAASHLSALLMREETEEHDRAEGGGEADQIYNNSLLVG